jgi:hypothetical protein
MLLINIKFSYYKCDDLLQVFGEQKLNERYNRLFDEMSLFLNKNSLQDKACVSKALLASVVIDYFNDIMRLKKFHTDIEKANSQKVIAYTSHWILYRKPIQIIDNSAAEDKELVTLNERFILQYILDYLSEREREQHILLRRNLGLRSFAGLLLYWLVYRPHDAQSIEMIITAFLAGQIYERTDEDISKELHPYDR